LQTGLDLKGIIAPVILLAKCLAEDHPMQDCALQVRLPISVERTATSLKSQKGIAHFLLREGISVTERKASNLELMEE